MLARTITLLSAGLLAAGCSVERYATSKVADALSGSSRVFATDDDIDLVREATPFGLKLMESVAQSQPKHRELLVSMAGGFAQYAYAFVQQDADEAESRSFDEAEALRQRARKLYLRAREYGLRAIEVGHARFRAALHRDAAAAASRLEVEDVPALYWTAAAWGGALALSKDRPDAVADQPVLEALLDRLLELDPDYGQGAVHALLVSYEPARIGGERGAEARAREHFARAVELSRGLAAGPYLALAESVCVAAQQRAEFEELLNRALAIDVDRAPERRVENLIHQRRARWLLSRTSELFLE